MSLARPKRAESLRRPEFPGSWERHTGSGATNKSIDGPWYVRNSTCRTGNRDVATRFLPRLSALLPRVPEDGHPAGSACRIRHAPHRRCRGVSSGRNSSRRHKACGDTRGGRFRPPRAPPMWPRGGRGWANRAPPPRGREGFPASSAAVRFTERLTEIRKKKHATRDHARCTRYGGGKELPGSRTPRTAAPVGRVGPPRSRAGAAWLPATPQKRQTRNAAPRTPRHSYAGFARPARALRAPHSARRTAGPVDLCPRARTAAVAAAVASATSVEERGRGRSVSRKSAPCGRRFRRRRAGARPHVANTWSFPRGTFPRVRSGSCELHVERKKPV